MLLVPIRSSAAAAVVSIPIRSCSSGGGNIVVGNAYGACIACVVGSGARRRLFEGGIIKAHPEQKRSNHSQKCIPASVSVSIIKLYPYNSVATD